MKPYSNLVLAFAILLAIVVNQFSGYAVANYSWLVLLPFAVFGIVFLGLFLKHPSIAVFYILLSIPFGGIVLPISGKTPSLFFPSVLSIILLTVVVLRLLSHHKFLPDKLVQNAFSRQQHLLVCLTLLYIVLVVFSTFQLVNLGRSLYIVVIRCLVLGTFVLVVKLNREPIHRIRVLQCVVVVGAAIAVSYLWNAALTYGMNFDMVAHGLAKKDNLVRAGFMGVTNTIGSFMAFTLPLTCALISLPGISRRQQLLAIVGLVLQLCALIATNSRGGVISFLGGILLVLAFSFVSSRLLGKAARVLLVLLVLGGAAFIFTPEPIVGRYKSVLSPEVIADRLRRDSGRLDLLEASWRAFLEKPLTGIGIGNVGLYDLEYGTGSGSETHNLFLQTLAEEGIFAFFILNAILLILGFRLFNLFRRGSVSQMWILAAFLSVLLNANAEPTFWHPPFATLFWLSSAVLIAGPMSIAKAKQYKRRF